MENPLILTEEPELAKIDMGCAQIWNPRFREMPLSEIEKSLNLWEDWVPYGYTRSVFNRSTATVYLYERQSSE